MVATRVLWRYTENTHPNRFKPYPDYRSNSELEIVNPGERCDWAAGGVYEHHGWAVPVEDPG